jgi:peptidoglycan-N-acetylglucosamine deacetylase
VSQGHCSGVPKFKDMKVGEMPKARLAALAVLVLTAACSVPPPGAGDALDATLPPTTKPAVAAPDTCAGYVSLTFDDGPTDLSKRLLAVLQERKVPAVFFNTGEHTAAMPDVIKLEATLPGVQFGNHTWNHPDLGTLSVNQVREQITKTKALQGKDVTFFRPPFGNAPAPVLKELNAAGLFQVLWTRDSKDFDATSVDQIVEQSKGMKDGGILLLHDGHPLTIRAVPLIIDHYHSQGLCFGKVARSKTAQAPVESPALTFYAKAVAP